MNAKVMDNELLADLHVLSHVPENGRVCVVDGRLSVEPAPRNVVSMIELAARRWWNHDNRSYTLLAIECLILKCSAFASSALVDNVSSARLKSACEAAICGINNLRHTYANDASTYARLGVFVERITLIISSLDKFKH